MILYHGTSKSQGEKIINEGFLKINQEVNYDDLSINGIDLSTTKGFLFLTNLICYGCKYGNDAATLKKEDQFYIFKLDIPKEKLLPDYDEIKMKNELWGAKGTVNDNLTASDSLTLRGSVSVNFDLDLNKYDTEYIKVESTCSLNATYEAESLLKFLLRNRKTNDPNKLELLNKKIEEILIFYPWVKY